jgi:hypothetical protein
MLLTGEARAAFDLGVLAAANLAFEAEHPRGRDGRFVEKGGWVKFVVNGIWQRAKVVELKDSGKNALIEYAPKNWTPAIGDVTNYGTIVEIDGDTAKLSDGMSSVGSPSGLREGIPLENLKKRDTKRIKELWWAEKQKATLDPSAWLKTGGQAGSNVGGFYEDPDGKQWYVKTPRSKAHAANEHLMNRLYAEAGTPTKDVALSPDGTRFLTEIVDSTGWGSLTGDALEKAKEAAAKDFVVDAWLANWDAPVNSDNIRITPDNRALRVDAGGAGLYRARGSERNLTPNVGELQSMRDPNTSRAGAALYSKVTREHEEDATKRILGITPDRIREMVKEEKLPDKLAMALITRRAWLANHYGLALPETTPEGIEMLKDKPKTPQVVKVVSKLSSPDAVNLVPGAPIYIKGKNVGTVTPAGARTPQIMMIKTVHPDGSLDLETFSQKVQLTGVPAGKYEALRDNRSRVGQAYTTGEDPQIGDEIETKTGVKGTVVGFWVNSALAKDENGKSFSVSIKDAKRLVAGEGSLAGPSGVTTAKVQAALGEPMDVTDPKGRFPLMAFSKKFNAEVFVLEHDPMTEKAKVAVVDSNKNVRTATVKADTLFPPETVDREAAAALFTKINNTPRKVQAAKALVPLEQLPLKTINLPGGIGSVDIEPGDRVFKMKERGNSQINFFKITKDGDFTFIGKNNNRGGYNYRPDSPVTSMISLMNASSWRRGSGAEYTDITPGRYNEAANELGPKMINIPTEAVKFEWAAYDRDAYKKAYADYTSGNRGYPSGHEFRIKGNDVTMRPKANDKIASFVVKGSKPLGYENTYAGDDDTFTVPRMFLNRDGKIYDIGKGGRYFDKPDRWVEHPQSDWDAVKSFQDATYNNPGSKEAVLADGTKIRMASWREREGVTDFNTLANNIAALEGSADKPIQTRVGWTGEGETWLEGLARTTVNWKLDPNAVARATPGMPAGPAEDASNLQGVKALQHTLTTSREQILKGENDDRLEEIMFTEPEPVGSPTAYNRATLFKISDDSVHGDPYMAQFAKDLGGDQQTLVAPTKLFNMFKKMSDSPVLHRGVGSYDQAEALKTGNHFNGTGVYGNGIYTTPHLSTAGSYGSGGGKVSMAIKPGAKWLENTEAFQGQSEDIAKSIKQRQDILAGAGFPSMQEIEQAKTDGVDIPPNLVMALQNGEFDLKNTYVRAALLTSKKLRDSGLQVRVDNTPGNTYDQGQMKLVIETGRGPGGVVSETLTLTFKEPWNPGRTSYGRRTQTDPTADFFMQADIIDENTKTSKMTKRIDQRYNSGWFMDRTTEALTRSGIGAQMSSDWGSVAAQSKKIDARISFLSDPGRWALASGYDYIYIPGERHHVFTHRAAFIVKDS